MKTETPDPILGKALKEYEGLIGSFKSIQIATSNEEGVPDASYSPAVTDEEKHFYVYVSEMSAHTANLLKRKKASVMVIADESASSQIFARNRVTFACDAREIGRDSGAWNRIMGLFEAKFGGIVDELKGMADFHLIELVPAKGRLVIGFGRAFDVTGENLDQLEHIKGEGGQGHRPVQNGHAAVQEGLKPSDVERIVSHMNDDHADSVLLYVKHFAKREDATSARLDSISAEAMRITLESGEGLSIPFAKPLRNAHDAHMVLVDMSKEARKALAPA